MDNHIDVGEGMTYCEKHKCWWQTGEHCIECEKERISKCVEMEDKNEN